jgi:predicted glycosyltransferase
MYCHDRFGLGHTTRTLKIAAHLAENLADCSLLVLTDLAIVGRFKFPPNTDYVHLPGLSHSSQQSRRSGTGHLNLDFDNTRRIRRKITQSAARTFQPNLFLVECNPLEGNGEIQRILAFVREDLPDTKVIWGLPDTLGEPEAVVDSWRREGIGQTLACFCHEIWVHGAPDIFDYAREYQIPAALAGKLFYTGYLRSPGDDNHHVKKDMRRLHRRKPFVLVTAGSGAEGYALIDHYLRFLEAAGEAAGFHSLVVCGPMMRSRDKLALMQRAQKLPGVIFHRFRKNILQYVKYAGAVICTGGYNTLCEIISYRKPAVLVPPTSPPREHLLRAQIFDQLGLVKLLSPAELTPERLGELVSATVLAPAQPARQTAFPLEGLQKITARIEALFAPAELPKPEAVS